MCKTITSMKKFLTMLLAALCLSNAGAANLTASQAQAVAQQFLSSNATMRAPAKGGTALSLAYEAKASTGDPDFYVFNRGTDAGYILVAGDDMALPVLGYSDTGAFDYDQLPENAKWWLSQYQKEMNWLRNHPGTQPRQAPQLTTSVAPLMATLWDQTDPFNRQCPTYSSWWGNQRCATGCVATATAQIMKYHQWPAKGKGSHSYDATITNSSGGTSTQTLSANFAQSTYQWGQMINDYRGSFTNTQANAVAKLMSDVGIAVEMNYGPSSGTSSYKAYQALKTYFDYDASMRFVMRDFINLDEWELMLRNELDAGRPVYYSGSGTEGGHAFVFDGYDNRGYFHVNWGWSGTSNDYYASTLLTPPTLGTGGYEGGFNSNQDAIIGIKPNEGGVGDEEPLQGYMSSFTTAAESATLGSSVDFDMSGVTFLGDGTWNSLYWGITITNAEETQTITSRAIVNASDIEVGSTYGASGLPFTLPSNMTNGEYHVYSIYSMDNTGYYFARPEATPYILMTVVDGTAYFSGEIPESRARLTLVTDIAPKAAEMSSDQVQATAVVKAEEADWAGTLTACIMQKADDDSYTTLSTMTADVNATNGQQTMVTFNGSFDGVNGQAYYLALLDPAATTETVWGGYASFTVKDMVPMLTSPVQGDTINFGAVEKSSTNIQQITVKGENLSGNLTLSLSGDGAAYYKLSTTTMSATNAMRGTKVNLTYRPTAVGQHDAMLTITGGGMEQAVTVNITGQVAGTVVRPDASIASPDFTISPDDVGNVVQVPFILTMPEGGNFTNVEFIVTFPEGLKPGLDEDEIYGFVGDDVARKRGVPVITFSDNMDDSSRWPVHTILGVNLSLTPTYTNPAHVYTMNVTPAEDYADGVRDLLIYAKYTDSEGISHTAGTAASPVVLAHVTFTHETGWLRGDINLDGSVDIEDVNILINIILESDDASKYGRRAYITDDDSIDISDVNELINIILAQ